MTRREALALLGALTPLACGGPPAAASTPQPLAPVLHLDPAVDLVAAAGLVWLIDARPQELLADPSLAPALAPVLSAEKLDAFAMSHAGVDLRSVSELVVATTETTRVAVVRTPIVPRLVEAAFAKRALSVDGRAAEGGLIRLWGTVGDHREQVALFGNQGMALERGPLGPLRAVVAFAQGKLHRALPALRAAPLASVAAVLGDAPLRAFAPGPFTGAWAAGLGGVLRAATAVGASLVPLARPTGPVLVLRAVISGAWGDAGPAAAERLKAAVALFANDNLGKLLGLDHPIEEPRITAEAEILRVDAVVDAVAFARGLHAIGDARVDEVMR